MNPLPARLLGFAVLGVMLPVVAVAGWVDLGGAEPVAVRLIESDGSRSVVEVTIGGFAAEPVTIDGQVYNLISLEREGEHRQAGYPELPCIRRGLIIPDDQQMGVRLLEFEYRDLADMPVAPSKGNLLRTVNPGDVPYKFDAFYGGAGSYPEALVSLDEPHIIRDFRGVVFSANVFQYTPATKSLRVYTRMVLEVAPVGPGGINVLQRTRPLTKLDPQFADLYRGHFLNFESGRYDPVLEDGGLLIITYDAFLPYIEPFAAWKRQKGLPTRLVTLSETGPSYSQIKAYILGEYQSWDLAYVLLIGDAAQLPIPGADSDPGYSLLVGGDSYPEIFVGRFSAENAQQLTTQVERSIQYERDLTAGNSWLQKGTGIASNQGPGHFGEYDNQHEDLIRQDLLRYGYTEVDQIYDPTATIAMISNALNSGRGIVNYTGHGSTTSWGTTGFSNTNVNALVNDSMLPFIQSVACNNGTFTTTTCFAEAWMRATNGIQPAGAIACYMSYISQSWDPPMDSQDEAIDLLTSDQMRTIGGLWFNGSCKMIDLNGTQGATEFRAWTIFGDPTLAVRTMVAEEMLVNHTGVLLIGMDSYEVNVSGVEGALCALYADGTIYGAGLTDASGQAVIAMAEPPASPTTLTLTVTAYNKVTVIEDVTVLPPEGPYVVFETLTVMDDQGDADGLLDEGELVELDVTLRNVGVEDATGVLATLSCADPYITLVAAQSSYPDIPAGGMASCEVPFEIQVAGDVPDEHVISLTIQIAGDGGTWESSFTLTAQAPVLAVSGLTVYDNLGGNNNGGADAGETVYLTLAVANSGHSACEALGGVISSSDANVLILDSEANCDPVPMGGEASTGFFQVEILPDCPEPSVVVFALELTGPGGFTASGTFELPVGGWLDNMEQDRGWTVGATGDNATSGIWVRADPVGTTYSGYQIQPEDDHTPAPGTICFITGNGVPGGAAGDNDVDGGKTTLLSPIFDLEGATSAVITYWRWYSNAYGNDPNNDWWNVDVTSDGVNWVSLEHTMTTETAWVLRTFDLADYVTLSGQVRLRFVAEDAGTGSLVEAGVDDFLLTVVRPITTATPEAGGPLPVRLSLGEATPNPFNPKTTLSFDLPRAAQVELAIYDLSGQRVATLISAQLAAGHHEQAWEGRDQQGRQVSSGVYFSRLKADGEVLSGKLLLLK